MANIAPRLQALTTNKEDALLLAELGKLQRNVRETLVDTLERKTGVRPREVREFFIRLQDLGCGDLVLGRKGAKTRFVWAAPAMDVAAFALDAPGKKGTTFDPAKSKAWVGDAESAEASRRPEMATYSIPLADGQAAKLQVPHPLSKLNAQLLAQFVDILNKGST